MGISETGFSVSRPSLIWGFDFIGEERAEVEAGGEGLSGIGLTGPEGFRWLHLNITDQSSCRWIEGLEALPDAVRELILSPDTHPRALVTDGFVAGVVHDFEVDFGKDETARVGALRFAVTERAMITARHHPLYAADVVKRRLDAGTRPASAAAALELLVVSIAEMAAKTAAQLNAVVQAAEDALLQDGWEPDQRSLVAVRRRAVQIHRQLTGLRGVLQRMEEDEDLPEAMLAMVEKLAQRIVSLDGDVLAIQADLRLLREELDIEAGRRTNRNLYVLSILSALLLPATLVTGFFGMNTGGFPFAESPYGTFLAGLVALASAGAVYLWLRGQGFLGGR